MHQTSSTQQFANTLVHGMKAIAKAECLAHDEENQNLLGKIDRLNKQRLVTVARLENQSRNLKVVREAVGECREGGNKLAAALIESMQHDIEILEHELRNFS